MLLRRGLLIHPEEIGDYWIERLKESGLNLLGIHPVGGAHAVESLNDAINFMNSIKSKKFFDKIKQIGFEIEFEMHAISWLLPRDEFNSHPNWFRMNRKGERINDFNLCPSNKDALNYIKHRAQHLAQIFVPTTNRYYFWLDDVQDSFCHCDECRSLTPSDQAMLIYNAILRGIKKINPNAMQCYLAYNETIAPPVKIEPESGIFLEFAPIHRDFSVPINDPYNIKNSSQIASIRELISYFGSENAQVLEYWMDNSLFSNWKKPPKRLVFNQDVMKRDVEYYNSLGFNSITSFACYLGEDYFELHGEPPIKEYGQILATAYHKPSV